MWGGIRTRISWRQNWRYPAAFTNKSTAHLMLSMVNKKNQRSIELFQRRIWSWMIVIDKGFVPVDSTSSVVTVWLGISFEFASINVSIAIIWTTDSNSNQESATLISCSSKWILDYKRNSHEQKIEKGIELIESLLVDRLNLSIWIQRVLGNQVLIRKLTTKLVRV